MQAERPSKPCLICGREMTWRKKWEKTWDEVKYCSDACRRRTLGDADRALEAAILELLKQRSSDKSICPSEVARRADPDDWERLMPAVRDAGRRLAVAKKIQITQAGRVIDGSRAKGPIRYRKPR